jgi:hypothetical protein
MLVDDGVGFDAGSDHAVEGFGGGVKRSEWSSSSGGKVNVFVFVGFVSFSSGSLTGFEVPVLLFANVCSVDCDFGPTFLAIGVRDPSDLPRRYQEGEGK